jgi:hypothetical protein
MNECSELFTSRKNLHEKMQQVACFLFFIKKLICSKYFIFQNNTFLNIKIAKSTREIKVKRTYTVWTRESVCTKMAKKLIETEDISKLQNTFAKRKNRSLRQTTL